MIEILNINLVWLFVIASYLITFSSLAFLYFRSVKKLSAITYVEVSKEKDINRFSKTSIQKI
ncbi:MAG: hypothetical protein ACKO5H_03105 [Candidatus Fonsibacter sp.]